MSANWLFTKPLVLGHRGDCAHAPENTLASFRMALEQGADGIELDARLTRDRAVMVLHDAGVERVTHARGKMAGLTMEEIRCLDAGSYFAPAFRGERIPALEEVFAAFTDRPIYDLEIKNFEAPGNGLEAKVLELVRRFGLEKRVIISSFNPLAVRYFRRELPQAPAGLLLLGGGAGRLEETLVSRWAAPELVGLYHTGLTDRFMTRQGERHFMVWGTATPAEVCRAVGCGAVAVIADDPAMARKATLHPPAPSPQTQGKGE
jgi:glycerophosphoryl diester phosphodiesterase